MTEMPCPETSDEQHCGHWHDGEKCCACGQFGPERHEEERVHYCRACEVSVSSRPVELDNEDW